MCLLSFTAIVILFSHMFHPIKSKVSCAENEYISLLICTNLCLNTCTTALGIFDVTKYTASITTMILFIVFTSIALTLLSVILTVVACNNIQ